MQLGWSLGVGEVSVKNAGEKKLVGRERVRRPQDFQFSFRPETIGHYMLESVRIREF